MRNTVLRHNLLSEHTAPLDKNQSEDGFGIAILTENNKQREFSSSGGNHAPVIESQQRNLRSRKIVT